MPTELCYGGCGTKLTGHSRQLCDECRANVEGAELVDVLKTLSTSGCDDEASFVQRLWNDRAELKAKLDTRSKYLEPPGEERKS